MLPPRFSELVELTVSKWDWDYLPNTMDDIWGSLMSQIFLGPRVRTSQASYIREVLEPFICYSNASKVDETGWSDNVLSHLNSIKNNIVGTPNESKKRAIITLTEQEVADLNLSRTMFDSLNFIQRNRINVSRIHQLISNNSETINLAYSASKDIFNVALTKAVLWFYGCGIAKELVPPNSHVVSFLNQYKKLGYGWDSAKWPPDWDRFTNCCNMVKEISDEVATELSQDVSSKQVQAAIWYLQTCRGLLSRGKRQKMDPDGLLNFLDHQNWSIKNLEEHIVEIDLIDELELSLNTFIM